MGKVKSYYMDKMEPEYSEEYFREAMDDIYAHMDEESVRYKKEADRLRADNKKLTKKLNKLEKEK